MEPEQVWGWVFDFVGVGGAVWGYITSRKVAKLQEENLVLSSRWLAQQSRLDGSADVQLYIYETQQRQLIVAVNHGRRHAMEVRCVMVLPEGKELDLFGPVTLEPGKLINKTPNPWVHRSRNPIIRITWRDQDGNQQFCERSFWPVAPE